MIGYYLATRKFIKALLSMTILVVTTNGALYFVSDTALGAFVAT